MKGYRCRHNLLISISVFAWIIAPVSAHAQGSANPPREKWRPKNGIYALTGKDFSERCQSGDFSVAFNKKNVTGDEWSCDIKTITDTGPGAIRLDMSCTDVNLEASIPRPESNSEELRFKETMTFRKIDEKFLFIRKSQNGKTNFPESKVAYCPQ